MTTLVWVLVTAVVALVLTRTALQWRAASKSRLYVLAREYLGEQLKVKGIRHKVPARCIAEFAEQYARAVGPLPLGRLATTAELMKRIDAGVAFMAEWVRNGREFPRHVEEMPLPGLGAPDALQEDVPSSHN